MDYLDSKIKKLFVILCMTTLFSANLSKADEATCRDVLHKCDTALKLQQEENQLQKAIIEDQGKKINLLEDQVHSEGIWKPLAIGGVTISVLTITCLISGICHGR